ncbi:FG-GAP-like repeat-containing protein [Pilimelia columellifera]|uniref:Uncharacterized protein n=1 Tax=Pilimelia columellifera subsp. columellifera TaxID=706583 RepID=A0ABN3NK04_9ACTN
MPHRPAPRRHPASVACVAAVVITGGLAGATPAQAVPVTFASRALPAPATLLTAADLDRDGQLDLVGRTDDSTVTIMRGAPGGVFTVAGTIGAGMTVNHIAAGDLNADGDPDLVLVHSAQDRLTVHHGAAGLSFAAAMPLTTNDVPTHVAIGDANGDGRADIASASDGTSGVDFFHGQPGGGFPAAQRVYTGTAGADQVILADANGDGRPDLLVRSSGGRKVGVLLAPAYENSDVLGSPGGGPEGMTVGDVNKDGKLDIVIAAVHEDEASALTTHLGRGDGTFAEPLVIANQEQAAHPKLADFDGDGDLDLAYTGVTSAGAGGQLRPGDGAGGFGAPTRVTERALDHAVADLDHNGRPDLTISGGGAQLAGLLLNQTTSGGAALAVAVNGGLCVDDHRATVDLTVDGPSARATGAKLSVRSNNAALVAPAAVTFAGAGKTRTMTFRASAGRTGVATLTVVAAEGGGEATTTVVARVAGAGGNTVTGGAGVDVILGQNGRDVLNGGPGDDIVCGGAGDDVVTGGPGDDVLSGDVGADRLTGADGDDILFGAAGDDRLNGDGGNDRISGGAGRDALDGGAGDDRLNGDGGDDRLTGGPGADHLYGDAGRDSVTDLNVREGDLAGPLP